MYFSVRRWRANEGRQNRHELIFPLDTTRHAIGCSNVRFSGPKKNTIWIDENSSMDLSCQLFNSFNDNFSLFSTKFLFVWLDFVSYLLINQSKKVVESFTGAHEIILSLSGLNLLNHCIIDPANYQMFAQAFSAYIFVVFLFFERQS